MGKLFTGTLLVLLISCWCGMNQGKCQNEVAPTENAEDLINGYPAADYYYTTVEIPAIVEKSAEKSDQINVAIHYKIVEFEKNEGKPLKSLEKNAMENLLAKFETEAIEELGFAAAPTQATPEYPAAKPALIPGGDDDQR